MYYGYAKAIIILLPIKLIRVCKGICINLLRLNFIPIGRIHTIGRLLHKPAIYAVVYIKEREELDIPPDYIDPYI